MKAPEPPLSKYQPFNTTHYFALQKFYLRALENPDEVDYTMPTSPSSFLVGLEIESRGWRKKIEAWELYVVDKFLEHLAQHGLDDKPVASEKIDAEEVAKRVFSLWAGRVQRGETEIKDAVVGQWEEDLIEHREEALRRQRAWKKDYGID